MKIYLQGRCVVHGERAQGSVVSAIVSLASLLLLFFQCCSPGFIQWRTKQEGHNQSSNETQKVYVSIFLLVHKKSPSFLPSLPFSLSLFLCARQCSSTHISSQGFRPEFRPATPIDRVKNKKEKKDTNCEDTRRYYAPLAPIEAVTVNTSFVSLPSLLPSSPSPLASSPSASFPSFPSKTSSSLHSLRLPHCVCIGVRLSFSS